MSIYIQSGDITDMQWPCPTGYHVPTIKEWNIVLNYYLYARYGRTIDIDTLITYNDWNNWWYDWVSLCNYLLLPKAWTLNDWQHIHGWDWWYYWASTWSTTANYNIWDTLRIWDGNQIAAAHWDRAWYWDSIRPFKDTAVVPDSTWTALYSNKIYHNSTLWLISISADGNEWITIADKNLWATTVYNSWATLSESNWWNFYQRWNNYWFPFTWAISTSSTRVNASAYWPWNYYSSSTFIIDSTYDYWDSSMNLNLRWWETWPVSMKEIQNIYIGEYKPIYKWEYIEYKMNADSLWALYIPVCWRTASGSQWVWYNWKVSIDGWTETTKSWTGGTQTSISFTWYTAWSNHTIKITPVSESYWWARAYSWEWLSKGSNLTEIVYDCSYMWYASSETNTWGYFRAYQYQWCDNISKPAEEYLPDTVTNIWLSFRAAQYYYCTSITYSVEECLPNSITTIWDNYRSSQYSNCTALTEIKWWMEVNSAWSYYRQNQYYSCTSNKTVKVLTDVWKESYDGNTLSSSYVASVSVPNQYLTNFKKTSNKPWRNIDDSKFIWY